MRYILLGAVVGFWVGAPMALGEYLSVPFYMIHTTATRVVAACTVVKKESFFVEVWRMLFFVLA